MIPRSYLAILVFAVVVAIVAARHLSADNTTITFAPGTLTVIDGDTVKIGRERVRFDEIDAPETWRSHCAAEHAAGERAKQIVTDILATHSVTIEQHGRDRYGRILARMIIDGKSLGSTLIEQGAALPYYPGRQAHHDRIAHWCGAGNW